MANARFVQYQCVVPIDNAATTLTYLLEKIAASGQAAFLAVLKRMGAADNSSLGFGMDGYSLALDIPMTAGTLDFYEKLNEITVAAGGRVYWPKMQPRRPNTFAKCIHARANWKKLNVISIPMIDSLRRSVVAWKSAFKAFFPHPASRSSATLSRREKENWANSSFKEISELLLPPGEGG